MIKRFLGKNMLSDTYRYKKAIFADNDKPVLFQIILTHNRDIKIVLYFIL